MSFFKRPNYFRYDRNPLIRYTKYITFMSRIWILHYLRGHRHSSILKLTTLSCPISSISLASPHPKSPTLSLGDYFKSWFLSRFIWIEIKVKLWNLTFSAGRNSSAQYAMINLRLSLNWQSTSVWDMGQQSKNCT